MSREQHGGVGGDVGSPGGMWCHLHSAWRAEGTDAVCSGMAAVGSVSILGKGYAITADRAATCSRDRHDGCVLRRGFTYQI